MNKKKYNMLNTAHKEGRCANMDIGMEYVYGKNWREDLTNHTLKKGNKNGN